MKQSIWYVDAFTSHRFGGNPAAVVLLDGWLPEALLQAVAAENNLSETAFIVPSGEDYRIRWFTPTIEVPLCGHATLASAWVVLNRLRPGLPQVVFESLSGRLPVRRDGQRLVLDFPIAEYRPSTRPEAVVAALGAHPQAMFEGDYWMAVYASEADVLALKPNMAGLLSTGISGVIATAPGNDCDFVSRFFAPVLGVAEDPVTGSAHTRLVPYWARRLGRESLHARQVSRRGGELWCELAGERVMIAGEARLYLQGEIEI